MPAEQLVDFLSGSSRNTTGTRWYISLHAVSFCSFVMLSLTLSCPQSLHNQYLSPSHCRYFMSCGILSGGTSVVFIWVPSRVGLAGNSAADIATKAALLLQVSNLTCFSFGIQLTNTYSGTKTVATKSELSNSEQADWTKGEYNELVPFTSPRWDYYSHIKNWVHISNAWTLTRG